MEKPGQLGGDRVANVHHQGHGHPPACDVSSSSCFSAFRYRPRQGRTLPVTTARAFKAPARTPTSVALQSACARAGARPKRTPARSASWAQSGNQTLPLLFALGTRNPWKRASFPHQVDRPKPSLPRTECSRWNRNLVFYLCFPTRALSEEPSVRGG